MKIGEGVMSLRRAFRIAGAQTVLASHWKVDDKATSQLMTEFIRRWRSGEPRAKGWREAQLSLLRSNERYKTPFFLGRFHPDRPVAVNSGAMQALSGMALR